MLRAFILRVAYHFVIFNVETPFMDTSGVSVISEALVRFIFKFLKSSKHFCKVNNAILASNSHCTVSGQPPIRLQ